jgi:hypothetical protein
MQSEFPLWRRKSAPPTSTSNRAAQVLSIQAFAYYGRGYTRIIVKHPWRTIVGDDRMRCYELAVRRLSGPTAIQAARLESLTYRQAA